MFDVVAKLFVTHQIKFSEGRLELLGNRTCITPTITYTQILKVLIDSKSQFLIYNSAKQAGFNWFKTMSSVYKGMTQSEALKWGTDIVSLAGWGVATLEKSNLEKKTAIFIIKNSTVAKVFGQSKNPVDHLFRGLVAGGTSFILKEELECVETHCIAKGDKICRFLVAPINTLRAEYKLEESDFRTKIS